MAPGAKSGCEHSTQTSEYALRTLPADERATFEAHVRDCAQCRGELAAFQPIVDAFVDWPKDVLSPKAELWDRLVQRIGIDPRGDVLAPSSSYESAWNTAAPGISYKTLAKDTKHDRINMLVRLAPNVPYPPHAHADIEELYLLDGELWIDDVKLRAGDYYRAEPGSEDRHVWSETGCTCVLMTSLRDVLR